MPTIKKSEYRLRVYQSNDAPPTTTIVFSADAAPLNSDGTEQKLVVDQDVIEVCTVSDHVSSS